MVTPENPNPYAATSSELLPVGRSSPPILKWMLIAMTVYYVFSSVTLPLADDVWIDELPLFAVPQLPKS